jgi:hypothetical protein
MGGDAAQNVRLENVDDVLDPESGHIYVQSAYVSIRHIYDSYSVRQVSNLTHIQYVNPAT